jgi:hypothetical protein
VLAVGAQTVMLGSLLTSAREMRIDEKKERFGRAVMRTLDTGLFLMIVSGAAATALHVAANQFEVVGAPAFIFKWILLIGITGLVLFVGRHPYTHFWVEGVLGAQLYALLVLHVLAPLVAWTDILVPYAIGTIVFIALWTLVLQLVRRVTNDPTLSLPTFSRSQPAVQRVAPVVAPAPVVMPAPPSPPVRETPPPLPALAEGDGLPVVIKTTVAVSTPTSTPAPPPAPEVPQKPELAVPQKPIDDILDEGLPTIRVMPQRPEDVHKQMRQTVVQFGEE